MVDISVNYMGLELKSPFIAASSGYTADIEKIVALARSGAGAIVLKSLFEEQINDEVEFVNAGSAEYPENEDFLQRYITDNSIGRYMDLIKESKKVAGIPVIASINCYSLSQWTRYAKDIEDAGADALELNIYRLPLENNRKGDEIEKEYLQIIKEVSSSIKIPVAVKIGENFTNIGKFVQELQAYGASGAVLFNRFFLPDVSLKSLKIVPACPFSSKNEYLRELRWIALLSSRIRKIDFSASSGVYDPSSAIKLMLSGAKTVQLCSVLYRQGPFIIGNFIDGLKQFMQGKGFRRTSDFRGILNYSNVTSPQIYERVQFLKTAWKYSHPGK